MKIGIIAAMDEELKILAETLQHSEKAVIMGLYFIQELSDDMMLS
jgi:adenosylhomocysteine nucleosidase